MAVSCRTLSLGHILMGYVFGAVIAIAHGNLDGGNEDDRDDVHHVAKPGSYYAAKLPPPIVPLVWGVPSTQ